jgi:CubicO group peptidase (beta-lactamase class C family)
MKSTYRRISVVALMVALSGCTPTPSGTGTAPSASTAVSTLPSAAAEGFPVEAFADITEDPVSEQSAAELQDILDDVAGRAGISATVMSADGTWSGATGKADAIRDVRIDDQFAIASITKTLVAAQVMQLVEAGKLGLDDSAADYLPPELDFDTNGATIVDLLSMRSGLPETLEGPGQWKSLTTDPLHAWTREEVLETVGPERGRVGEAVEYRGTNYVLLGLIVEHVTQRPLAKVLRSGVLAGNGFERLIYQPDERPTEPMAMPYGASADTFDSTGGYLPSLAAATAFSSEGAMASDSLSLARWFRRLCAGQVTSSASLDEMTDFDKRPEYGLGIIDRSGEYGADSGAVGHTGLEFGFTTGALCFQQPGIVVVVLANAHEYDVDTVAGKLWQASRD